MEEILDETYLDERQHLLDNLKSQIDYYFTKENLSSDGYLLSLMNEHYYVPLSCILEFKRVSRLTDDISDLVEALETSKIVELNADHTMIRPRIVFEKRCIIIRDIDTTISKDVMYSLFDSPNNICNIKTDIGNTWFITFDTEEEAAKELCSLKSKRYNNEPIKARLKSERIFKQYKKQNMISAEYELNKQNHIINSNIYIDPTLYVQPAFLKRKTYNKEKEKEKENTINEHQSEDENSDLSEIDINTSISQEFLQNTNNSPINNVIPYACPPLYLPQQLNVPREFGYKKNFKKYTSVEIYDIVQNLTDISLPDSIQPGDHSDVLVEANRQLLERGRTVSFDEAISIGRPRILSVTHLDYISMIDISFEDTVYQERMKKERYRKKNKKHIQQNLSVNQLSESTEEEQLPTMHIKQQINKSKKKPKPLTKKISKHNPIKQISTKENKSKSNIKSEISKEPIRKHSIK
ncbi:hypothetical protein WA158_000844 [Blastocystis sp. Blastoise]